MITLSLKGFFYPKNVSFSQYAISGDGNLFAAAFPIPKGKQSLKIYYQSHKCIQKYIEISSDITIEYENLLSVFQISKISEHHYFILIDQHPKVFAIYDFNILSQKITKIIYKVDNPSTNQLHQFIFLEYWQIGWLKVTSLEKFPEQLEFLLTDVKTFNVYPDGNILKLRTKEKGQDNSYILPQLDKINNQLERYKLQSFYIKLEHLQIAVCRRLILNHSRVLSIQSQELNVSNKVHQNNHIILLNGKISSIGLKQKILRTLGLGEFYLLQDARYAIQKCIDKQQLNNIYDIQNAQVVQKYNKHDPIYLNNNFIIQFEKNKLMIYQIVTQ